MNNDTTSPTDDLEAIRAIRGILEPFGPCARQQILNYLIGRYQLAALSPPKIVSEEYSKLVGQSQADEMFVMTNAKASDSFR